MIHNAINESDAFVFNNINNGGVSVSDFRENIEIQWQFKDYSIQLSTVQCGVSE